MRLVKEDAYVEYGKSGNAISCEFESETGLLRTVSQGKSNPRLLNLFSNRDTLLDVHSQGLFAEHMKVAPGKLDREFSMRSWTQMMTAIAILGFPCLMRASDAASSSVCDAKTFSARTPCLLANV